MKYYIVYSIQLVECWDEIKREDENDMIDILGLVHEVYEKLKRKSQDFKLNNVLGFFNHVM